VLAYTLQELHELASIAEVVIVLVEAKRSDQKEPVLNKLEKTY
jgi:hypothetical protein